MPIRESVSIDDVIDFLNEINEIDPDAIHKLVERRVQCNERLADHSTVQVRVIPTDEEYPEPTDEEYPEPAEERPDVTYQVGLLGILNGIFGINDNGWGPITANFDLEGVVDFVRTTHSDE